jgi:uncharacterized membrane protein
MSDVIVATYAREDAAEHVLGVLRAHQHVLAGELDTSATVRVAGDGAYTVTLTDWQRSSTAFWGVFWEALFGLVFLVPTPGMEYGANLGGLFGAIDRAGLDAAFRARLRSALGVRTSGLAVIATGWNAELMLRQFPVRPVALITASLVLDQDAELIRELGGPPPSRR